MGLRLCELSRGTVLHRRCIHSQTFTPAEQLSYYGVHRTKNCQVGKSKNFFLLTSCFYKLTALRVPNVELV